GPRAAGWRRPASAAAATIASPRRGGACSRPGGGAGPSSWRRCAASWGPSMRDFRPEIRRRLADLDLDPVRSEEIVEELAQHLEDRHRELVGLGAPEGEARRVVLEELATDDV